MFRIVDRGGAVVAASAAVVCLATLSWIAAGGSSRYDRPGGYPGASGDAPSLSAPSTAMTDSSPAAAAPQQSTRTGDLTGGTRTPYAAAPNPGQVPTASADPSADASASGAPTLTLTPAPGGPDASPSASPSGPQDPAWGPSWPSGAPAEASGAPGASPSPSAPAEMPPVSVPPSTPPGSVSASPSSATTAPSAALGRLTVGTPRSTPDSRAGCLDVTVTYDNEGRTPVRSGRIVITTDVLDGPGAAWAPYRASTPLPVPIAAGARPMVGYDLCLGSGHVPSGVRLETAGVALRG